MIRAIIAAAALAVAGPAWADDDVHIVTVFKHKHWQVDFVEHDNGAQYCSASVSTDDLYFSLDVTTAPGVTAYLIDDQADWENQVGQIDVWFDLRKSFYGNVHADASTIVIEDLTAQFLSYVAAANMIYFDYDRDGYYDVRFSLAGSRAALNALGDCRSKLGGLRS